MQTHQIVTHYFDGTQALELYDNGHKEPADSYMKGTDGFAIAIWKKSEQQLALDVPNSLVLDDGMPGL